MNTTPHCPSCHKPLAPDAPKGLCPQCLLQAGFPSGAESSQDPSRQHASGFVPPSLEELAPHFPQLELLEFVGRGGMGAVYKARQKQLNRIVALKILPPSVGEDPAFAERFMREAQALAQLNHPGIVTLYEFGERDGLYFFLMEFVDGVTLRQLLQGGRVSAREALAIVPQICDALQYAHDEGVVHRDIKPENILMDRRGRVKVADFGLAKLVQPEADPGESGPESPENWQAGKAALHLTDAGKVLGTPSYMAPEQVENPAEVDHRADIYALGVVFYQMLTGELPGKQIEPPSRKVRVDVRLDEVVLRALEKDPERRYGQASVLKTQVENIASESGTPAPPHMANPTEEPPCGGFCFAPSRVKIPAIGLILAGVANLLPLILLFFFVLSQVASRGTGMRATFAMIVMPVIPLLGSIVIWGAARMLRLRSYGLAVTAAILAMLTPPGFLVGLPFGIWALVVLSQREVREVFEREKLAKIGNKKGSTGKPRYSRAAIAGAVLVTFAVIAVIGALAGRAGMETIAMQAAGMSQEARTEAFSGIAGWLKALLIGGQLVGGICAVAGTLLGWIAVVQIRLSRGRLRGMPLALFDSLLFPLLFLVVFIPLAWTNATASRAWAKLSTGPTTTPAASVQAKPRVVVAPPFTANFPGGTVELIALAPHPSTNGPSWLANGKPFDGAFPLRNGSSRAQGKVMKEVAFRLRSNIGLASFPITRFGPEVSSMGGSMENERGQDDHRSLIFIQTLACEPWTRETNIRLGVAAGAWEEVITLEIGTNKLHNSSAQSGDKGSWEAYFEGVQGAAGDVALSLRFTRSDEWETRMVGFRNDGKWIELRSGRTSYSDGLTHQMLSLSKQEFLRLSNLTLQRRKYHWVEFNNVSLKPGNLTSVTIQDALLAPPPSASPELERLSQEPHRLRSHPNEKLVQVALSHPDEPWAWQELRSRAEQGKLGRTEALAIMTGLIERLRKVKLSERSPIVWEKQLIETLIARDLVPPGKVLELVKADHGELSLLNLPRLRVGANRMSLHLEWRQTLHPELFGLVLLNEMRSVTIDGRPAKLDWSSGDTRQSYFHAEILLPELAPGTHTLKCEVYSALIPAPDLAGLPVDAPSQDWPPASLTWTQTVEEDFEVHERNVELVKLTLDPALDPARTGGLAVEKVVVRRLGDRTNAVVTVTRTDELRVPVAFDIFLQVNGQEYPCGYFWKATPQGATSSKGGYNEKNPVIAPLPPEVQTGTVILRPRASILDHVPGVHTAWGREIRFENVPLTRQDLSQAP